MWDLTHQNFAQKFRWYAYLYKFQIFLDQLVFVVKKRLVYEKVSFFNRKYDLIKIK